MTDETRIPPEIENWGYLLLGKSESPSPGPPGLVVAIRPIPTQEHYDPERMVVCLLDPRTGLQHTNLHLQPSFTERRQVCPGHVNLYDRIGKQVSFFTFGGELEAHRRSQETLYLLRSSAPILELDEEWEAFPSQLASETEALLAEIHAAWGRDDAGYAGRLARIDPFDLYRATLRSLIAIYTGKSALRHTFPAFYAGLEREQERLVAAERWPASGPTLEELLAPGSYPHHPITFP